MTASRASKSAPKHIDRCGGQAHEDLIALRARLAIVEQTLRAVVEELKARKVLPAVIVVRGPKRVRMSPEAVRAQRQDLLAAARERIARALVLEQRPQLRPLETFRAPKELGMVVVDRDAASARQQHLDELRIGRVAAGC